MFEWVKKNDLLFFVFIFLALPSSPNYKLEDYGFGTGGISGASSPNYSILGITGELSGAKGTSPNYQIGPGLIFTNQANVPEAPTFTNPDNYYNKLSLIINPSGNPDDTIFAVAVSDSSDDFATTRYVQSDNTIGDVLGAEDYQTYVEWGGASGITIIGLAASTTYKVKAKAMQGKFTETGYGPEATAATVNPTLSFGISTNTVNFGELIPSTINTSPQNIVVSFATNANSGGKVYVTGSNAGLYSAGTGYKINAVTSDLSGPVEGFGAQGISATQSSGGPLTMVSPYNQGGENVGITDSNIRNIFNSANPIVGGSGEFVLKAKPASTASPASDYTEILTIMAAGNF